MFEQVGIVQHAWLGQKSEQTIEKSDLCLGYEVTISSASAMQTKLSLTIRNVDMDKSQSLLGCLRQ